MIITKDRVGRVVKATGKVEELSQIYFWLGVFLKQVYGKTGEAILKEMPMREALELWESAKITE